MTEATLGDTDRTLVMVAHGTRTPAGVRTVLEVAAGVSASVGSIRTAFVDVLGPSPAEVLASATGPAIVVPAFLASGFHVRTDLPAHVAASGHHDTTISQTLGPDPQLAAVMHERLREVGWQPGDGVVMAAAGSSDPVARGELRRAARLLGDLVGEVHLAHIAMGTPTVADVVTRMRAAGTHRVFIAPYLLAHGFFHARLADAGADIVAAPLGVHPRVVDLISSRFAAAMRTNAARAARGRRELSDPIACRGNLPHRV